MYAFARTEIFYPKSRFFYMNYDGLEYYQNYYQNKFPICLHENK